MVHFSTWVNVIFCLYWFASISSNVVHLLCCRSSIHPNGLLLIGIAVAYHCGGWLASAKTCWPNSKRNMKLGVVHPTCWNYRVSGFISCKGLYCHESHFWCWHYYWWLDLYWRYELLSSSDDCCLVCLFLCCIYRYYFFKVRFQTVWIISILAGNAWRSLVSSGRFPWWLLAFCRNRNPHIFKKILKAL